MTAIRVSLVDVYPVRVSEGRLEVLVLRRSGAGRCPGAWEVVHGHIEEGERPAAAALRELREETAIVPARLVNLSRVELFFQHRQDEVSLVPVFAALVDHDAGVTLSAEHDAAKWVGTGEARARLAWPRSVRVMDDLEKLMPGGDPGPVADVLVIE